MQALTSPIHNILARPLVAALLCFTFGSLAAASMAPMNWWFTLFAALPVFYLSIQFAKSSRYAALYGWLFGFGYFAFGLYWIGNALLVEGNPYRWVWPLAVAGLPTVLALYWAAFAFLACRCIRFERFHGWLAFGGLFALTEWVRGHLFTGFPWNLFGYTWTEHLEILQVLFPGDVYFLTLLTILWASAPALYFSGGKKDWKYAGAIAIASFALVHAYGQYRLAQDTDTLREDVRLRVVQPNIDQAEKWRREMAAVNFEKHLSLTRATSPQDGAAKTVIAVWPETAFTYRYANDPLAMEALAGALRTYPGQAFLLGGMLRYTPEDQSYGNSLVMADKQANISNIYDKSHLVPFGEYIPLQNYIPLKTITSFSGFTRGPGPQSLPLGGTGLRYSPLVCYEIIFPGASVPADGPRPDFIVNATNDGWYGDSNGPYQHFVQAQYRAVENGLPVVRAANTGISGIIAPSGRILQAAGLLETAAVDGYLPASSSKAPPSGEIKFYFFFLLSSLFAILHIVITIRLSNND